ncbi:cupin domain-containing protein [Cutibacterium acnes]|uniref:cupin domain-containing protein n=1 Tax=Cutibacterium acnes TaxID=1747 RepID=UPI000E46B8C1|nr:cupin domain-containing protein [Cutibacterium acnes]RHV99257.1 cupin domain-containing protein [Propionibacterium sp. KPL2009]
MAAYAVTFAAEAHTHWHTHPKGQGLYVTGGVALVHIEGQAPQHLTKGESIWIDAGQRHWHGAALKQPMIHLTYQQAADDLSTIDWQEPVIPTTYSHETKENR